MTEPISVMDIDGEDYSTSHSAKPDKGKNVVVAAGAPPESKATPWVEKYRPQSLADVAAHRDIVDTSNHPRLLLFSLLGFRALTVLLLSSFFHEPLCEGKDFHSDARCSFLILGF